MDRKQLVELGKELGLTGKELQAYVKEELELEMARQVQMKRDEAALLKETKERELEWKERESVIRREEAAREVELKERETVLKREEAAREREAREREVELKEREAVLKREETEREIAVLKLRAEVGKKTNGRESEIPGSQLKALRPKLPTFDEQKDDMDSFLLRFERFASSQNWAEETWAVSLSPLLKGKGLEVYSGMPPDQVTSYHELKRALLKRYELTEEGFRQKFRGSRQEKGETAFQFVARMSRYFKRWVDLAETERGYEALEDLLLREQFVLACAPEMALFLKERRPKTIDEMTRLAEQYMEAHACGMSHVKVGKPGNNARTFIGVKPHFKQGDRPLDVSRGNDRTDKMCFLCNRKGHIARQCKEGFNRGKKNAASADDRGFFRKYRGDKSPADWRHQNNRWGQDSLRYRKSDERQTDGQTAALCQSMEADKSPIANLIVDGQLPLADGKYLPVIGGVCDKHSVVRDDERMPVLDGFVGKQRVKVLRDTGCSSATIRRSLVSKDQLTGKIHLCVLIDSTIRRFPIANVHVDTPYYTGEIEAMCIEEPLYDLIIGNIAGVRMTAEETWKPSCGEDESSAVITRAQARKSERDMKPLKTSECSIEAINVDSLKQAQKEDETLKTYWEKAASKRGMKTRGGRSYEIEANKSGVLYRIYKQPKGKSSQAIRQVVVPKKFRRQVMSVAHKSIVGGHLGVKKTLDRIATNFYWPGIAGDVMRWCKSCDICQKTIPKGKVPRAPLGEMPLMEEPFQRVAVDLIGPISPISDNGNRYILTIVDYATRYPEAVPLKKIETERVAEALLEVFTRVGFPREILSDQGSQFMSQLMKEICRLVLVKQLFTTPYNPKCNGLCERINGVMKDMLRKMCQEKPKDWDRYLPAVLFAYREVPQASTGFSPFELLYGRTVRGPIQILKELWTEEDRDPEVRNTYEYVLELRNRLEETCRIARESIHKAQGKSKRHYDKKAKNRQFRVGQRVIVLLPTDHNKLLLKWKGPFEIEEVVNKFDYKITVNGKPKIYHINLLKLYEERDTQEIQVSSSNDKEQMAFNAIIEPEEHTETGVVDDDNLLMLSSVDGTETYRDVQISNDLTDDQRVQVLKLLYEYRDIFTERPGSTNLVEHDIKLTTNSPIRTKPYPLPYAKRADIQGEVEKMLAHGIIEPSDSPYNSPVVMVKKNDGNIRFCIDFRKLKSVTVFDNEPMGDMEGVLADLQQATFFSKVDFSKGYWQIPMKRECRHLTAFTTPTGCFQFLKLPFGLVNSGASFNRMMRKLLKNKKGIVHYVDDVVKRSQTWSEHLEGLRDLFQCILDAGLTVPPSKCMLGFQSIEFLGHKVGNGSVSMDDDKLQRIRDAPPPETKKQVRSFLGLTGFYRKFIPCYAEIATPLTDLTKKNCPNKVDWGPHQHKAFVTLKELMCASPIFCLPNFSRPFILQTDASSTGVGAALMQECEDGCFPIAYASKKLLPREQNYSVIERECLAIVFGVKKFQKYLYGTEFLLRTDHKPLTYIQNCKAESGRILRWALLLQNYSFKIEAIKGSDNVLADYLSRQ